MHNYTGACVRARVYLRDANIEGHKVENSATARMRQRRKQEVPGTDTGRTTHIHEVFLAR